MGSNHSDNIVWINPVLRFLVGDKKNISTVHKGGVELGTFVITVCIVPAFQVKSQRLRKTVGLHPAIQSGEQLVGTGHQRVTLGGVIRRFRSALPVKHEEIYDVRHGGKAEPASALIKITLRHRAVLLAHFFVGTAEIL